MIIAVGGAIVVTVVLSLVAPVVVPLLVPGFSVEGKHLTVSLSVIQLAGLPGAALYAVLAAACVVRNQFTLPPIANLAAVALCFVAMIWKLPHSTIAFAGWAMTAVTVLPGLFLLPVLGGSRPHLILRGRDLAAVWRQWRPLVAGRAYFMTNIPIDRFLVSYLPVGSLSIFELAGRVSNVILNILETSTITPALPRLSTLAKAEQWSEFRLLARQKVIESVALSVILLGAAYGGVRLVQSAASAGIAGPILGKLASGNLSMIGVLIVYMSAILPFTTVSQVLSAAYCARRDTATLTRIGAAVFTAAVPARVAAFLLAGVQGIVVATGAAGAAYCLTLQHFLRAKDREPAPARAGVASVGE